MANAKRNVFWLGLTSFFTDVSSEMIFAVLPIFLKNVLQAPFAVIGLIDGLAEGISSFLKYISGWLSDAIKKRKALAFAGYSLSTLSKLFLIFAAAWPAVLVLRFLDRAGKGIRTSPRDALISESVGARERGKFFGLHRAMDSAGAFLGVGLVILIFYLSFEHLSISESEIALLINKIFFIALGPAILALIPFFFVKDVVSPQALSLLDGRRIAAERALDSNQGNIRRTLFDFTGFSKEFYQGVLILSVLALANISYAFFLLKSQAMGVALFLLPVLYLIYNLFYALFSYPAGKFSDKLGRVKTLAGGFSILGLVFLAFGFVENTGLIWILFALYGLSVGITDSVSKAFVADLANPAFRGKSFGLYYTAFGFSSILGNMIFGFLWDKINATFPFILAGLVAIFGAFLLLAFRAPPPRGKF